MLSVFPALLTFELLAPFLRVAAGLIFLEFGYSKLRKERAEKTAFFENLGLRPGKYFVIAFGLIEVVGGAFILIGFLTQLAAAVLAIISIAALFIKMRKPDSLKTDTRAYLLLVAVLISLLFTGAGFFAFDLPL